MEYQRPEVIEEAVFSGGEALKKAPKLFPVPTGIEGLDNLFFTTESRGKRVIKKALGGIPAYSVFNITGASDTGKTLFVEQFTIKQASRGKRVAFITVETPASFVSLSLKERAKAMGEDFEEIEDNIVLIDAASFSSLRENIPNLLKTLAFSIKNYDIEFTIIDSITGLFEHKEMAARMIVRQIFNFLKKWYQTALLVSQKRSAHEELTAEAAGGYAVGHIVDGTIVMAKELIMSWYQAKTFKKNLGEVVRLFRIDGCRMCGHDTKTYFMEITETGLVKITKPLTSLQK